MSKEVLEGITKMTEALIKDMRAKKIISNDRTTNDIEVAIRLLNGTLEEAWKANFKVDIYLDKDGKVCPVFYD